MKNRVFVLGSTGSIGVNTLNVISHLQKLDGSEAWEVVGLAAGCNSGLLAEQANLFGAKAISLAQGDILFSTRYYSAVDLLRNHAKSGDIVVVAIVGFDAIESVDAAIEIGCKIALANKETLVSAGEHIMAQLNTSEATLVPVDSEHSAIFQAISNAANKNIKQIILTASGGPFRQSTCEEIENATRSQVLNHPTWNMGEKVTVDSASLMNKALELIEARWLFGMGNDRLAAIIHPQSIVHGIVEFIDGSSIAQLAPPDMKFPIQYALTYPDRSPCPMQSLDWREGQSLIFEQIDEKRFPAINMAREVISLGGTAGAIFNAANEVAVEAFLNGRISFGQIYTLVEKVLSLSKIEPASTIDVIKDSDILARKCASEHIQTLQSTIESSL